MTLVHFWPLVAKKAKKLAFEISKKMLSWLLQPPEAENDRDTQNQIEPDLMGMEIPRVCVCGALRAKKVLYFHIENALICLEATDNTRSLQE